MWHALTDHLLLSRRLNAFEVFLSVQEAQKLKRPVAVIRLGDGEGAVLGYPGTTSRTDIDRYLTFWLRRKDVPDPEVFALRDQLREAIEQADILGIPRPAQERMHHCWAAVRKAVTKLDTRADLTLTALHRLMQHALLYRPILLNQPFVGLVSCRDVSHRLQDLFRIKQIRWYGIRGARDQPGITETPHWPDGFEWVRQSLEVPFRGAVFLVGGGVFGKIYCHWIKQRGGIAIDIGSIFDSWAGVGRVGHPVRGLAPYTDHPRLTRRDAVKRYNELLRVVNLSDVPKAAARDALPKEW